MTAELFSPLPAATVLERISERLADPPTDARPLAGRMSDGAFSITVRPAGRPPYIVVARVTVISTATGSVVRATLRLYWLVYPLLAAAVAFLIGGVRGFFAVAPDSQITQWRAWPEPLGAFVLGLLFLVVLTGRRVQERDVILDALRDATRSV